MNQLTAHIESINTEGQLSLINLTIGDFELTSIVIETQDSSKYIKSGEKVKVLFKETEVIIATTISGQISLQNQLPGKIINIEKGKLLTSIVVEGSWGILTSIITTNAANRLQLVVMQEVIAMVKTNEIMLSPC